MTEQRPSKDQLPEGWIPLGQAFGWIADRVMIKTPEFVINNWDCKYIDARIDMRTGSIQLSPGNARPAPPPAASKEKSERLRAMVDKIKMRPEPMPGMTPVEKVEREFYERYIDPSRAAQPPGDVT